MGAIRLFLACIVAIDHLRFAVLRPANLGIPSYSELGMNAGFAVMFFYMISGFLISTALSRKYLATREGTLDFYESRFVRIFSLYWPIAALALTFDASASILFLDNPIADKLTNIFVFGIDWRLSFATYPNVHWPAAIVSLRQSWTLGAELTFYVLAPYLLRSWTWVWILLAASAVTRAAMVHAYGYHEIWTYYFLPSTLLFFLIGHIAQSVDRHWGGIKNPLLGWALVAASIVILLTGPYGIWDSPRFWMAALCFAAALPGVFHGTRSNRFLNLLGDLSYPLYLVHHLMIIALSGLGVFIMLPDSGPIVTLTFLALTLIAATAAHCVLEKPGATALRWIARVCRNMAGGARAYFARA
jgi:peptidoglycan/LPS O-acetylase OafA/YrhL